MLPCRLVSSMESGCLWLPMPVLAPSRLVSFFSGLPACPACLPACARQPLPLSLPPTPTPTPTTTIKSCLYLFLFIVLLSQTVNKLSISFYITLLIVCLVSKIFRPPCASLCLCLCLLCTSLVLLHIFTITLDHPLCFAHYFYWCECSFSFFFLYF